jgi:hypothetical protein
MSRNILWIKLEPGFTDLTYTVTIDKLSEHFEKVGDGIFKLKDNIYLKVTRDEVQIYVCDNENTCH